MAASTKSHVLNNKFVSHGKIRRCVQGLFKIIEIENEKYTTKLFNDKRLVYLQINLIKIPDVEEQSRRYICLPHSIHGDSPEICLIVADRPPEDKLKRTTDELIEHSINFYEKFLKKHDVDNISAVMPWTQLASEYATYELKANLVKKFDIFAVQTGLLNKGKFPKLTGKTFTKKNKFPLPLKFPENWDVRDEKFRKRVENLSKTTWFYLRSNTDTLSIRIGNASQSEDEIYENLIKILTEIQRHNFIPGGMNNVGSILLKTSLSRPVPIYVNLSERSSVKEIPLVKSNKPQKRAIEGELTTQLHKKVAVLPSGEVFLNEDSDASDSEEEDSTAPESTFNHDTTTPAKKKKLSKKAKSVKKKKDDEKELSEKESDSDDSEEEINKVEKKYLSRRFQ